MASGDKLTKADAVSVEEHEKEWNEIFDGIHDVVDACAFQDGHIDYDELDAFFSVNKSWPTNTVCSVGPMRRVSTVICR